MFLHHNLEDVQSICPLHINYTFTIRVYTSFPQNHSSRVGLLPYAANKINHNKSSKGMYYELLPYQFE